MESKVIETKEISEEYTFNGNKKTRTHTLRAMDNNGSKFVNYRCGRQSVNISKDAFDEIQKVKLTWKADKETNTTEEKLHAENVSLQKQINDLKKLIKGK